MESTVMTDGNGMEVTGMLVGYTEYVVFISGWHFRVDGVQAILTNGEMSWEKETRKQLLLGLLLQQSSGSRSLVAPSQL